MISLFASFRFACGFRFHEISGLLLSSRFFSLGAIKTNWLFYDIQDRVRSAEYTFTHGRPPLCAQVNTDWSWFQGNLTQKKWLGQADCGFHRQIEKTSVPSNTVVSKKGNSLGYR